MNFSFVIHNAVYVVHEKTTESSYGFTLFTNGQVPNDIFNDYVWDGRLDIDSSMNASLNVA
jgi:hypothetical protein